MAESATQAATHPSTRQNALAEIHFASAIDPDLTPSEDETTEEKELQLETVQSAIGVSIGQQQTHLLSPKTPAAEKAAALDDTDGGVFFDTWPQTQDGLIEQPSAPIPVAVDGPSDDDGGSQAQVEASVRPAEATTGNIAKRGSPARMPSPWRAGPKAFQRVEESDHRAALRESFRTGSRRRAMSGGSASEAFKKYFPFNLPSMPKSPSFFNFSLPSFSASSSDSARGLSPAVTHRKRVASISSSTPYGIIPQRDGTSLSKTERRSRSLTRQAHPSTEPIPQRQFAPTAQPIPDATIPHAPAAVRSGLPTPTLRRSTSEGSLTVYRSFSFASSLGDDSRFENVSEQVNSRLKAIKDSWQDSNFKLPSMPNFSLGSREDLFKSRNASPVPRESNATLAPGSYSRRVSFLASSSNSRLSRAWDSSTNVAGTSSSAAITHPNFTKALQELTGDLVVLGGYRGSILRSAEAPNRQLWVPIKVGLNLRKVDLELGLNPEDEETMEERIIPGGMLKHIGPVDIAKRLFKRLRACENAKNGTLRVHDYGYDWRLSPHILSRRMIKFLESLPCNQPGVPPEKRGAIILAHSLGGQITRHAINQRPDLVAGVVYAGVPQGCVNILGPLRNGDDVLLSSRVLTAQVNFTIRTSFALLPLDGKCFINKYTKEEYPVDFFDINTWKEYRLSPCIATPFPHPNTLNASSRPSVSGLLNAMSSALPSLPGRKPSVSKGSINGNGNAQSSANLSTSGTSPSNITLSSPNAARDLAANAASAVTEGSGQASGVSPQMSNSHATTTGQEVQNSQSNPATAVTIPQDKAIEYLTRTLAEIKAFKLALAHRPEYTESNQYPPIALIYGKSTPTVYGAKVESREAIKRADAYDELAFRSGDGVVLARSAQVPEGYSVVKGGVVSSDRGHVTLLGDLEAVGRCLSAVIGARKNGVGLGKKQTTSANGAVGLGVTADMGK